MNRPTPSSVGTVLQFEAAPPSMDSDHIRGKMGGSSSKDAIAPLDVPDVNEGADRLTQQSSYWRPPTEKVSDSTWVRVVA
ncbi:hypothetical protein J3R82DRAFT_10165 [Butyriboletus roseoflavus]|nr:hypothetical protein J3R82DRAFT_10165 [Butyriboletus roseoflavus]